jgi:hypothetical protein
MGATNRNQRRTKKGNWGTDYLGEKKAKQTQKHQKQLEKQNRPSWQELAKEREAIARLREGNL